MKLYKLWAWTLLISLLTHINCVAAKDLQWQNDKVQITLYNQYQELEPSQSFKILIKLKLLNGWHISWDNPGDAGTPTEFHWKTPQNWTVERKQESTPQKFIYDGIITQYGYSDTAYYLFTVNPAQNTHQNEKASQDNKNLVLSIDWVACKDYCEPESADFKISLHQTEGANTLNPQWKDEYKLAAKTFPKKIDWKVEALNKNYFFTLKISNSPKKFSLKTTPFYFIPYQRGIISADAKQSKNLSKNNTLEIFVDSEDKDLTPEKGILVYGDESFLIDSNLSASALADNASYSILYILFLAFIGGIILNFMPCIFPILSVKAISLAQSANKEKHFRSGLLYLSGVISCFTLIASILYLLRHHGESAGWGFQLQSPIFVGVMLFVFVIIFLMMLDLITLKGRLLNLFNKLAGINSFMTGFFAVLIASPCTGPFMGAALGYALFQPPHIYFPIFISLGLGYALPFTLIEIYPSTIKKILPKPGKWMSTFKKIFALPILLTCLWLSWVLFNQLSQPRLIATENSLWQEYNPELIENLVKKNQPVFIDFTAKWCITCLVNEQSSINTPRFSELAKKRKIHLFKADWTNQNADIATALKHYGRNSIPLYVYYSGKDSSYVILPQILSPRLIEEYLDR